MLPTLNALHAVSDSGLPRGHQPQRAGGGEGEVNLPFIWHNWIAQLQN